MKRMIGLLLLLVAACASSGPRFAAMTADDLLQYGLARAEAHKWDEASRALEQFVFQFPTHARYQEARFRLGDVYFGKREYLTAASEYARLADDFPEGPLADDARFKVCDSYAHMSPRAPLDQEYTRTAIDHCQSLLAYYPESEFAATARTMVGELQNKLAEKIFLNGEFYYYDDVLKSYPTSAAAPRALLRLYETYTRINYTEEAKAARERLLRDFPDSEEARRVKEAAAPAAS
jgi:outer membrane protein assembly factor BamD